MKRGFRFAETMAGTMRLAAEPDRERPFSFSIEARAPSLVRHLRNGGETEIRGQVEAPGLAVCAPLAGTLTLAPLTRRIIRYEFEFTGDDGQPYRFEGQKRIRLADLRRSFTVLPGTISGPGGQPVAEVDTRFDLGSDWLQFLSSWRLA